MIVLLKVNRYTNGLTSQKKPGAVQTTPGVSYVSNSRLCYRKFII